MKLEDLAKLVNGKDYGYNVEKPAFYGGVLINANEAEILRELEGLCGEFSFEVKNYFLTKLNLSCKGLTYLPDGIGELKNLEHLILSDNKLTYLPEGVCGLKNLNKLSLYKNNLRKLPESFGELANLRELRVWQNNLTQLPESFCELKNLRMLYLCRNNLTSLPENFGELKNLEILALGNNKLTELPESFGELRMLKKLNISRNNSLFLNFKWDHYRGPSFLTSLTPIKKIWFYTHVEDNTNKTIELYRLLCKLVRLEGLPKEKVRDVLANFDKYYSPNDSPTIEVLWEEDPRDECRDACHARKFKFLNVRDEYRGACRVREFLEERISYF